MGFILNSFNQIQKLELALELPCGNVLDTFKHRFGNWSVPDGSEETVVGDIALGSGIQWRHQSTSAAWSCKVSKKVKRLTKIPSVPVTMEKISACCAPKGALGEKQCCVAKDVVQDDPSQQIPPAKISVLQQELGSL